MEELKASLEIVLFLFQHTTLAAFLALLAHLARLAFMSANLKPEEPVPNGSLRGSTATEAISCLFESAGIAAPRQGRDSQ
jgi:hypothetical protein